MTGYGRQSGVGAHGYGYRAVGATSTIMTRSVEGMRVVSEGKLAGGMPCLRLGQGAPLVMAVGGAAEHANPAGVERRISVSTAARFAGHFTVYVTSRKPGLAAGATMADIAADYAKAITDDIGEPVVFYGTSVGGAVAIGFPHLVRRLVLVAAACRLSPAGRQLLSEVAYLVKAGGPRRASALVAGALAPRPLGHAAEALAWVANPLGVGNPADMLITNAAAVAFDAEAGLGRVRAPALVMGGGTDPYYSEDLFRRTAAGIPGGRAVIFPGKGHVYASASKAAASIALGFVLAG